MSPSEIILMLVNASWGLLVIVLAGVVLVAFFGTIRIMFGS